jgi:DNA-binding MarR family transcriptional regulator
VSKTDGPGPELSRRLGYLLKHAQLRMAELTAAALASDGISGRELAVLLVLADGQPASQQQAALRLAIDRTTMVAMLDTLAGKGLVSRHPDAEDRRRNVVKLTPAGHDTLRRAVKASDDAEQALLAPLTPQAAQQLRNSLQTIVTQPDRESS